MLWDLATPCIGHKMLVAFSPQCPVCRWFKVTAGSCSWWMCKYKYIECINNHMIISMLLYMLAKYIDTSQPIHSKKNNHTISNRNSRKVPKTRPALAGGQPLPNPQRQPPRYMTRSEGFTAGACECRLAGGASEVNQLHLRRSKPFWPTGESNRWRRVKQKTNENATWLCEK